MAAAYRSEQRRLLSFLRMADFMMCDTLQTILVQSVSEMLAALEPASYTDVAGADRAAGAQSGGAASAFTSSAGGRSLQAMASMLNGSRRQRAAAAVAGMQLRPVTATQQAAVSAAAAEADKQQAADQGADREGTVAETLRQPLLEMDVVMGSSCEELSFAPEPEQFQVRVGDATVCADAAALCC